ncbi:MAG TPA: efflux RND transporter permease subunit, partial [Myxococcota bacterium]|nr:efflux RND transporter permease subunit [Myxococcota bacterium]
LSALEFMTIVLGGPIGQRELTDFAEHDVKDRLERIPGVGGVRIRGGREREVRIWLDPLRLAGYGLAIEDVADTLRRENAELASGRIEGAAKEWSVTTQGKARSIDEFGALIVSERAGRPIQLRDVALVEDGMAEERSIARVNGEPGVSIDVQQQSGSDLVAAARLIREELAKIEQQAPPGVEVSVLRDYARIIEEQISSVLYDMLLAAALVVAVVLVFMRNWRSTLIASLAIPASVIASFTVLLASGLSLNNMTLMALSLAVGLVIDDAIVVLESIFRRVERGEASKPAAIAGTREVALAVISTTLAVCGVFVPIRFMTSTMGRYFFEFGVAVTVAVLMSALVALTLTPMLASKVLRQTPKESAFFRFCERMLQSLEHGYARVLAWSLRNKGATVALALVTVASGCGVFSTLPTNYFTQDDLSEVFVSAKNPIGTPLSVTDRSLRAMEAAVREHAYVTTVFATAGDERQHQPHRARLSLLLTPKSERDVPIEETFDEIRALVADALPPGAEIAVGHPVYASSSGEGYNDIAYSVQGPDLERIARYAAQIRAKMEADPDFLDVRWSHETGRPQLTLDVDRGRAADVGVSSVALGRTLRTLLAGEKVGSFEDRGERYDVRVQVLPEYRDDPSKLDLIRVRSLRGQLVPIASAVAIRSESGAVEVRRHNRARMVRLYASKAPGTSMQDAREKLERFGAEVGIAPPYVLDAGGAAESEAESAADLGFALGLAMISIYMILASLFNSLTHPLTIMTSAPLSFVGGFFALKLSGMSFDIMGAMGLLVLMGLVMKNGILLVDYTNQLREQGMPRDEAILRAGPVRMRPVLMTSAALVLGLLPMALSNATGAEFRAPMAMIVIGGLATSTALTLMVVPVFYALIDGASMRVRAAAARAIAALRRPKLA